MTLLAGQNDRSIDYLGGDRPGTVAVRALYALRERVRVREDGPRKLHLALTSS